MNYYDENFQEFIDSTLNLDMSQIYNEFVSHLKPGSKVLDVGCGPGRDLKFFSENYLAIGLEPSKKLAEFARVHSGCPVVEATIQEFTSEEHFDGIWACASLLHTPKAELGEVFAKLRGLLAPSGACYCSFKYGDYEGAHADGRHFTYLNQESGEALVVGSGLTVRKLWVSEDKRPGRADEQWLNIVVSNSGRVLKANSYNIYLTNIEIALKYFKNLIEKT